MKVTKGDIFTIGGHVIACGNSLDGAFVSKVIGQHKVRAIVTDPPYGVAYVENKKGISKLGVKDEKAIMGDHLQSAEEYEEFTRKYLGTVVPYLEEYNAVYIFNADPMFPSLRSGMKLAGFYYSQMIIWLKNQPVMSRKDYLSLYELIAYGWFGTHSFKKPKDKSVLVCPKPSKSPHHPSTKPVNLIRRLILNSSSLGEVVYDGFLGSGTCLLACEQSKRACIGIEIDEEYCQTTIDRWERLTGETAKFKD